MDRPKNDEILANDDRAIDTMSDSEEEANLLFERNRRLRQDLSESGKFDD